MKNPLLVKKLPLILGFSALVLFLGFQPLRAQTFGNHCVFSGGFTFPLNNTSTQYDIRFTMPSPTRTLASVQLSGILTFVSPVTYVVSVQTDDGSGNPSGTLVGMNPLVVFTANNFNPVIPLTPSGTMLAGSVYHIVISYSSGAVSGSNQFAPLYSTPFDQFLPPTQLQDTSLNAMASFDGGSSWSVQGSYKPIFVIGFNDGSIYGNTYDTYSPAPACGTTIVGQEFTAPAGGLYADGFTFWGRRAGTPGDNLYYQIVDLTVPQTISSGTVCGPASLSPSISIWFGFSTGTPYHLIGGHQYRAELSSPNSLNTSNCYYFDGSTTTGPTTLTFGDTVARMMLSSNNGGTWLPSTTSDLGIYFTSLSITATNTPTNTMTATPTDTATDTSTPTPTNTPTITATNTVTTSATNTATDTTTQTPTNTATLTVTRTPTSTPTLTATQTMTNTPLGSATSTPTPDKALYLDQNYFDPTQQALGMDVRVDTAGQVKVMVFNIAGEEIEKLVDQTLSPGNYRFSWDGRNKGGDIVGNAVYFIVIQQPSGRMVRKIIVLK